MIAALLLSTSFAYVILKDEFTDETTHAARIGDDRGPSLSVECGALTGDALAVRMSLGRELYNPARLPVGLRRYHHRVRFDDRPTFEVEASHNGTSAFVFGADAARMIGEMKTADSVIVEMKDYRGDEFTIRFKLDGAPAAIARVEEYCPR